MLTRHRIARAERGFLFVEGDFRRFLEPGTHWVFSLAPQTVHRVPELWPRLKFAEAQVLARDPRSKDVVDVHRIKDHERGLVFREGSFVELLGPGTHVFLKSPVPHTVEIVDAREPELKHPARDVITRSDGAAAHLLVVDVPEGSRGLLSIDQQPSGVLAPGRYAYWHGLRAVKVAVVDVREQTLEVQGQELMTQDKVSLRLNLTVRWQLVDPSRAVARQSNAKEAFYRDVQLALRDEVGGRTFDELLARKEQVGEAIVTRVKPSAEAMGIQIGGAGIRDVILPGEMRTILNQVIEAEKRAQANMIARREETAATRNLMNTAKLLENNPMLLRLKELEATERVAEKIGNLSVYGGVEGLLGALQRVTGKPPPTEA